MEGKENEHQQNNFSPVQIDCPEFNPTPPKFSNFPQATSSREIITENRKLNQSSSNILSKSSAS